MSFHVQNSGIVFPNTHVSEPINIRTRSDLNLLTSVFTGNGVLTAFTLNFVPLATYLAELVVYVDRKKAILNTDFTLTGSVVTFSVAPKTGSFIRVTSSSAANAVVATVFTLTDFNNSTKQGQVLLVGGSVVVANTSVTANSRIFITGQGDGGGTSGESRVSSRIPGVSFTITSTSNTDASTLFYIIIEPTV